MHSAARSATGSLRPLRTESRLSTSHSTASRSLTSPLSALRPSLVLAAASTCAPGCAARRRASSDPMPPVAPKIAYTAIHRRADRLRRRVRALRPSSLSSMAEGQAQDGQERAPCLHAKSTQVQALGGACIRHILNLFCLLCAHRPFTFINHRRKHGIGQAGLPRTRGRLLCAEGPQLSSCKPGGGSCAFQQAQGAAP